MKDIFDRIGIYDFFCICGSGLCITAYSVFTVMIAEPEYFSMYKKLLKIESLSSTILLLIFAYFIGSILHEIGRIVTDLFLKHYSDTNLDRLLETKKFQKLKKFEQTGKNQKLSKPIMPFVIIRFSFYKTLKPVSKSLSFNEVWTTLRKNGVPPYVDKYHSIYGLNRGLLIGIILHTIVFCIWYVEKTMPSNMLVIILIDIVLAFILWIRTYRYYFLWMKTVFVQ